MTAVATSVSETSTVATVSSTTTLSSTRGPLEFVDGKFLGIRQGSLLADAAAALGVTPVPISGLDQSEPVYACTGTPDPWVIRTGGLTLVFESSAPEPKFLTNWRYIGGPVASFTEMVAPNDMRIGDTRAKLEAAYPGFTDLVDEIDVSTPMSLRFGVENDTVNWFGIIDCVMEGQEPSG